uniref:NCU16627-like protein n=1 Tax=Neurospora crassa TaxID=5141 RepID=A0A068B354_NEUCS|nr:NCU16627-like protein [Neurospora crassa]
MFHDALNGAEWNSKLPVIDPFQTFPDLNGLLPYRHEQSQQQPVNLRYCDKTYTIHLSILETLLEIANGHSSKMPPWSIVNG